MNARLKNVRQLLDFPAAAPDDLRRSRLLTVLLLGMGGLTFLTLVVAIIVVITGMESLEQSILLFQTAFTLLAGIVLILLINRSGQDPGTYSPWRADPRLLAIPPS